MFDDRESAPKPDGGVAPQVARKGAFRGRGWVLAALAWLSMALAAGLARADDSCMSAAERVVGPAPLELTVGYVEQPPLAWSGEGDPHEPAGIAADVLRLLAARNGWRLHFTPADPTDVVGKVAACKLDVGIAPPLSPAQEQAVDHTISYFDGVAAVVRRSEPVAGARAAGDDGTLPADGSGTAGLWTARVLRALLFGALALGGLMLLVNLVNLRIPRAAGHLPARLRLVALDPGVAGARGAWRWLWSARVGRILALVWLTSGIAIAVASTPATSSAVGSAGQAAYVSALRDSRKEFQATGVRPSGRLVPCPDLERCVEDLTHGDLTALAGDSETICHQVRANRLDGIRFQPNLLWPREHAFLVRPSGPLRRLLDAALARAATDAAADLAAIRRRYGVPWTAPVLARECPAAPEARR